MVPVPAPPPHTAPSPVAAAVQAAAVIHGEAVQALHSSSVPAVKAARLRLRSALALRERHLGRHHPLSLSTRGLLGLLLDREGDPRGLKLYAEACGGAHRQLLLLQRTRGQDAPDLLGSLEALVELYGHESLKTDRWEDRALQILVGRSKGVRPDLERRVVEALQRHYGPWLSFRPPDTEKVLEDALRLLDLWSRRRDAAELTRAFAEAGLRSDARGVWDLVARKGGEDLVLAIRSALQGLDPAVLRESFDAFLAWMADQEGRPWAPQALQLGRGLEAALDARGAGTLGRKVRLAQALGEPGRAAALLAEGLRTAEAAEDFLRLGAMAGRALDRAPDAELSRSVEETLLRRLPEVLDHAEGRRWLEAEARRMERAGRWGGAEGLWRALFGRPAPEGAPDSQGWNLGRNLAAQGRWAEARAFLEPLGASGQGGSRDAELGFLLSDLEQRLGNPDAAALRAREGLGRLPGEGPLQPVPGLAAALRRLGADASSAERRTEVLARLRKTLDPDGALPSLGDAAVLLALAERLEPSEAPGRPAQAGCGEPWTRAAAGAQEQAEALLRAARDLPARQAGPCLDAAVKLLEGLWGPEDPRLAPPLLQQARTLAEGQAPGAEAALRRLLALGAANPDLDPGLRAEALARLGSLLSEAGREDEAETLLRQALGLLGAAHLDAERLKEVGGGAYFVLLARLEDREDYEGALALMDEVEVLAAKLPGLKDDLAKELAPHRKELARKARIRVLLKVQGLP